MQNSEVANALMLDVSRGYGAPILSPNGEIIGNPPAPIPLALYSPMAEVGAVASIQSQPIKVIGSSGDDSLVGGIGDDVLRAGNGQDQLLGGAGNDRLRGGQGDDYLNGQQGDDRLYGGQGQDILVGGSGDDRLVGGEGDDQLFGQSGRDRLRGGQGQDRLDGGAGRDRLYGGSGDDRLIDRDGGDILTGGSGNDQFWIGHGTKGISRIRDFQVGRDQIKFMQLGMTYDNLSFERKGSDTLISFQDQQLVRLNNITPTELSPSSFRFGDAELVPALQAALESSQGYSPGAVLSVVTPDGSVWSGADGLANLENGTPMSVSDRLNIGSITKPMVAVTILQLMEEGQLSLDDTVSQQLPSLSHEIQNSDQITLRQLLNHSSGIPDYINGEAWEQAVLADIDRVWEPLDFVPLIYADLESNLFDPGEQYRYSNTNYFLLGLIVEAVTGDSLAGQLRSRIFEPLGMDNSFYAFQESLPGGFQAGYFDLGDIDSTQAGILIPTPIDVTAEGFGDGSVVSTASELIRFSEALHGGELLAPGTYRQMGEESAPNPGNPDSNSYGLGIDSVLVPNSSLQLVGHNGGTIGSTSNMYLAPDRGFTVVTLENQLLSSPMIQAAVEVMAASS